MARSLWRRVPCGAEGVWSGAMRNLLGAGASLVMLGWNWAERGVNLPVKAPPTHPVYDWTGVYTGHHVGAARASCDVTSSMPDGTIGCAIGRINAARAYFPAPRCLSTGRGSSLMPLSSHSLLTSLSPKAG